MVIEWVTKNQVNIPEEDWDRMITLLREGFTYYQTIDNYLRNTFNEDWLRSQDKFALHKAIIQELRKRLGEKE